MKLPTKFQVKSCRECIVMALHMPMPAISKIEIARLEANFAGCKPREDR
jgi:hypothetical protein